MSEDPSKESSKSEKGRFYEPRNWDKIMRVEEEHSTGENTYCGKCGHVIYGTDRFCTKCGAEARTRRD